MANAVFGEARASLSDGRELTLRYDFNALAEAEEADGRSFAEINDELESGKVRLKTARAVLFGGLRAHHPDISLSDAGELMLSDGDAVMQAMQAAMEAMSGRTNPRKGAAARQPTPRGTGTRSSKAGAKQG